MSGDPAQKLDQVGRPLDGTEARELLGRVIASESFRKSPRLRELLTYLCECAIRAPLSQIPAQQIGEAVFGRPPHYDSAADTIVRVQVSQLRKRLEHYFLTEGASEPLVLEIPRGSYNAVFHPRPADAVPVERTPEFELHPADVAPLPAKDRRMTILLAAVVML